MKFVFFGYDYSVNIARKLLKDGHELLGIFTFECDNIYNFNREIKELAEQKNVPITEDKITPEDVENFLDQDCEVFLSCGYPYKIPDIDETKAYGINMHPSYLPQARGIMPTPHIIMNHPDAAGFSIHKITPEFDAGEILYQERIELTNKDNANTYTAEITKRAPRVISKIMSDVQSHWDNATPQDESRASHFSKPKNEMRTINWDHQVLDIDRRLRAFGNFGTLCFINRKPYAIFEHSVEEEDHDFPAGTVTEANENSMKIAAPGGYITLKRFSRVSLN